MGSLPPSGTASGAALACVARVAHACVMLVAMVLAPASAWADGGGPVAANAAPDLDRARVAYDRGVRANAAGDHAGAARAFAEADALAPRPASLEAALESAMKADDAPLGAELVDRADGREPDAGLQKTLVAARRRFAGRSGKITVACNGEARCLASVDGAAADGQKPIYVTVGAHAVVVQRGDERIERLVQVRAGQTVEVGSALPPAGDAARASAGAGPNGPRGLSPIWFYAGAAATVVVGGVAVGSGLDAVAKHERFVDDGCGSGASGPRPGDCDERARAGESAQLRTNVLIGAAAVLAVTSVALAVFAVRWKDGKEARMTLSTSRGTALAGLVLVIP
jgi:hypothetical protein